MLPLFYTPRCTPQADRSRSDADPADPVEDATRQPVSASQARPSSGNGADTQARGVLLPRSPRWSYTPHPVSYLSGVGGDIECQAGRLSVRGPSRVIRSLVEDANDGAYLYEVLKAFSQEVIFDCPEAIVCLVEDANLGARLRQYRPDLTQEIEDLPWTQARVVRDEALCEEATRTVGRVHVEAGGGWRRFGPCGFGHKEFHELQSATVEMARAAEKNPAWWQPSEPQPYPCLPDWPIAERTHGYVIPGLLVESWGVNTSAHEWCTEPSAIERRKRDEELCRLAARDVGHTHAMHVLGGGGWSKWAPLGTTGWARAALIERAEQGECSHECALARFRCVERDARDAAYCRPETLPAEARVGGWGWCRWAIRQRLSDHPLGDVQEVLVRELEEADAAFREMNLARRFGAIVGTGNRRCV